MDFTVERHVQLYAVNSQGHGGGERLFAGDRTLRLGFAHRHLDLMLRFDADGFQEFADAHIEDFFVHGAPPVLWETAPLILAVCRNARRRGVDAQTLTRATVGKSVKLLNICNRFTKTSSCICSASQRSSEDWGEKCIRASDGQLEN